MSKINEIILTFFYIGKIKKAPGTFGSIGAVAFWFFLNKYFFIKEISLTNQNIFWGIFLLSILLYGSYAIKFYAKKTKEIDHKSIVLDEVLGQILALQMSFSFISKNYFLENNLITIHLILSFIAFRFFDIRKPFFIGYCDRHFKSGFGVMFDDLLCGIIVGIIGTALIIFS